jgi:glycosyltransferase involved in cell wall biosynthesis
MDRDKTNSRPSQVLVTLVTVARNAEASIERTLKSVAAVKDDDLEYIVIDGRSTDRTVEIVRGYGGLVDQFISEPDSGIYNAMNKGIKAASGDFILFINADDELLTKGFRQVKPLLAASTADVISCISEVRIDGRFVEHLRPSLTRLPFFNSIPHPSTFVRTQVMREFRFREDLRVASDYDLFLRLLFARKHFTKCGVPVAVHNRGAGASADTELSYREVETVKRERLGPVYPLVTTAHHLYRFGKRLWRQVVR